MQVRLGRAEGLWHRAQHPPDSQGEAAGDRAGIAAGIAALPGRPRSGTEKSGGDFLLFTSSPPQSFQKGKAFVYQAATKAKKGPTTFKLASAPRGMTVDATGTVRWDVPADYTGDRGCHSVSEGYGRTGDIPDVHAEGEMMVDSHET